MNIIVKKYTEAEIPAMAEIWNDVVEEGNAFPQEETLGLDEAAAFFAAQSCCGAAIDSDSGRVVGMYILHPNNVGRCGHICNASYAVASDLRGLHIGEKLVTDCIERARELGFGVLQFNAVVASNVRARRLYERLGFTRLGTIPRGFRMNDGSYADICPYYIEL